MCDPVTISAAAVTTAAGVAGKVAEHRAQKRAADENRRNALAAYVENVRALNLRGVQELEAAKQAIDAAAQQAAQDRGTAIVGALDAGVAGQSVAAQAQVLDRGLASYRATTLMNLDRMLQQLEAEKRGASTSAQSRINAIPAPSTGATALGIAGVVANSINDLLIRRPTPRGK